MGKPVLLIDADLRRPRLQKVFRGKMNLGLVNYLAANIPLEDVIQETRGAEPLASSSPDRRRRIRPSCWPRTG